MSENRSILPSSCPLCSEGEIDVWCENARDYEYASTDKDYRYLECAGCQVLFLEDPPVSELSVIYPSNYYSYDSKLTSGILWQTKRFLDRRLFMDLLEDYKGQTVRVLDVGGGLGGDLDSVLSVVGPDSEGTVVDLDESLRRGVEERGYRFFCGPVEEFKDEERFDIIIALNLIEHVQDPISILEKFRDLLKNDGIIIIKTPNYNSWDARLFRKRYWGGLHCPRHWVIFSDASIRSQAAKCELKVNRVIFQQGAPFWTTSVLGLLTKVGLIKVTPTKSAAALVSYKVLMAFFGFFDAIRSKIFKTSQIVVTMKRANVD